MVVAEEARAEMRTRGHGLEEAPVGRQRLDGVRGSLGKWKEGPAAGVGRGEVRQESGLEGQAGRISSEGGQELGPPRSPAGTSRVGDAEPRVQCAAWHVADAL